MTQIKNLNLRPKSTLSTTLQLLKFLHLSEKLKYELRHGWASDGRQESVAEHSWRVSLMVILFAPYLDNEVNLEKSLKIAVIHDLVEMISGDVPYFEIENCQALKLQKKIEEQNAIKDIQSLLESVIGDDIFILWNEYEDGKTYEAKFIKALDKIEAQVQQNEADISTWLECEMKDATSRLDRFCNFDSFLQNFKDEVQFESIEKMKLHNIDVNQIIRDK